MAETNLRQAKAKACAHGWVSEKDLKFFNGDKEVTTEEMADAIKGSVTIKTDETNFVRYNVNVSKKTKAGTDNKAYPGILTVKNEYKSIAEVGSEDADRVDISGDINLYQSINTGDEVVNYKSNFFNRSKKALDEFEPAATFEVEMFIKAIIPEVDKEGEETGRLKVQGILPVYNGVECITLIAPAEDGIAEAINSEYEPGQTVGFDGDIVNSRVEKVTEIPMKIGKPKKKVEVSYVNELIITGASEPYEEGITTELPYDRDTITAAMEERKARFEERKAKAQSGNTGVNGRPSAVKSSGRTLGF